MIRVPGGMRTFIAITHDACMAGLSFVLALWLRLGNDFTTLPWLIPATLIFTAICSIVFVSMRLYRGLWRYASLPDMVALVKAASIAVATFSAVMFVFTRLEGVPRSLPFINWLLLIAMLGAPRFLYRAVKDRTLHFDFRHDASKQIPVLLVGATDSAEQFIRDSLRNRNSAYRVVGILDDNPVRKNLSIHNIPIYGNSNILRVVVNKLERKGLKPQRLILCSRGLSDEAANALLEESERLGLPLGRLPGRGEVRNGPVDRTEIRPVAIEDLLERPQNVRDRANMSEFVRGKRVAVTGAGGSIGSELVRQIAALQPAELLLLEQGEHALYEIDLELSESAPAVKRQSVLADVRSPTQINTLFGQFRPQIVFHAAAVKHVPMSESNPLAAIETNVLGTRCVMEAASAQNVSVMVLVSTDKAVNPTNIMGATKRLAENICQAEGKKGSTRFVTVRFGNVLGSTGSVVPLFTRQLARGGPLTVTHPDMVRYFMTTREAVELVIEAAAFGAGRPERKDAVFVLEMGKAVRIKELADKMILLSGLKDIEIVYTGLRPGEKLFEELFYDSEKVERTECPGVLIAQASAPEWSVLQKSLDLLAELCKQRSAAEAVRSLQSLVPEFQAARKEAA